jgi:hypothetical protein
MEKQQSERMLLQAAFDGNLRLLRSNPQPSPSPLLILTRVS